MVEALLANAPMAKTSRLRPRKKAFLSRTSKSSLQLTLVLLLFASLFGVYLSHKHLDMIDIEVKIKSSLLPRQRTEMSISSLSKERTGLLNLLIHRRGPRAHCGTHGIPPNVDPYAHFPWPKTHDRGECMCTPVRFFVLLSMQRSGSGWLEALLNSHPNISSNGEIFALGERRANTSAIIRTLDEVYSLDWPNTAAKSQCTAAVGFKWQFNQGIVDHSEVMLNYFSKNRVSVIFLFRRNFLRRLISLLANDYDKKAKQINGIHKSQANSEREAEILARYRPRINTTTLKSQLISTEKIMKGLYNRFRITNHKILYYEDILKSNKTLTDVQKFLGVPEKKLKSQQVKIHRRPTSELIENWKDVYEVLNKTKYRGLLHKTD